MTKSIWHLSLAEYARWYLTQDLVCLRWSCLCRAIYEIYVA